MTCVVAMSSCSHAGVHTISMTRAAVSVMRVHAADVCRRDGAVWKSGCHVYPCQPAQARMRNCNATPSAIRTCAQTRTRDCINRCDERVHSGCMNVVPVSLSVCEPFSSTYASRQKKMSPQEALRQQATPLISVGHRAGIHKFNVSRPDEKAHTARRTLVSSRQPAPSSAAGPAS
jgi:hypothetical protein